MKSRFSTTLLKAEFVLRARKRYSCGRGTVSTGTPDRNRNSPSPRPEVPPAAAAHLDEQPQVDILAFGLPAPHFAVAVMADIHTLRGRERGDGIRTGSGTGSRTNRARSSEPRPTRRARPQPNPTRPDSTQPNPAPRCRPSARTPSEAPRPPPRPSRRRMAADWRRGGPGLTMAAAVRAKGESGKGRGGTSAPGPELPLGGGMRVVGPLCVVED